MKRKKIHFELAGARVIDTRDQLDFQFAYFSALQCVVCKVQCKFTYFIKYRDMIMHCCEKKRDLFCPSEFEFEFELARNSSYSSSC